MQIVTYFVRRWKRMPILRFIKSVSHLTSPFTSSRIHGVFSPLRSQALKYCRPCGAVTQTYWSVCMTIAIAFGIVRVKHAWIQRSLRWPHSPLSLIERKRLGQTTFSNFPNHFFHLSLFFSFSSELGKNVILEYFEGSIITFKSSGTLYPIQVNLFCEILHKLLNDDLWAKALTLCRRVQVNSFGQIAPKK